MSMRGSMAVMAAFGFALGCWTIAAVPEGPPKPGPELKKLDYWVGNWTYEGDMKDSPFGPGGKFKGTEACEWFPGGFHLTCRSEGSGPMGGAKGLGIFAYDTEDKVYTYYGIESIGFTSLSKGKVDGDTWNWSSESRMGGKSMKSRYVIRQVSPDSYTFKLEMSVDGGPWTTGGEGKSTRMK